MTITQKLVKLKKKISNNYDHDKYISTKEFNEFTEENFNERLKQTNLASKSDICYFVKNTDVNKNELNELSKKVKAMSTK